MLIVMQRMGFSGHMRDLCWVIHKLALYHTPITTHNHPPRQLRLDRDFSES